MTELVSKAYDALLKRLVVSEDARIIFAMHEGNDIGFILGAWQQRFIEANSLADESWSHASIETFCSKSSGYVKRGSSA